MGRTRRSAASPKGPQVENCWKDPNVDLAMMEAMEEVIPVEMYKPFSLLNIQASIKEATNQTIPIIQIEERLAAMYNMKVLDSDRAISPIFEEPTPFTLSDEFLEEFEVESTEKKQKR